MARFRGVAVLATSAAFVAALLFACVCAARAAPPPSAHVLLVEADRIKTSDREGFARILERLHQWQGPISGEDQRYLAFLGAWSAAFSGDYERANTLLEPLVPGNGRMSARALALQVHANFILHRYQEAYVAADRLIAVLPGISDPTARLEMLGEIIQMLEKQQQYELALHYAEQLKAMVQDGKPLCLAQLYETQVLLYMGKLDSGSPKFQRTIDTCLRVGEAVYGNALRLDLASLLVDEGHADRSIALLRRVAPEIRRTGYRIHIASLDVSLAQAYLAQGKLADARRLALATLSQAGSNKLGWTIKAAYDVLYRVEKRAGRGAAALDYFEKYVALDKAAMDDAKARALAYQMVRQEVLAKKLRMDALDKQNRILTLNRQLDQKAAETARLYIALLMAVIGFIALWLYRLKQSQVHFRRMARHDGLTGVFNRHHFLDESERTLVRLHKAGAPACLVVLDLDHFKRVNDTYGHIVGDDVLKRVAQVVRSELRASDRFGRLGGEEFGILMPSCTCAQGMEIAERIRAALAAAHITLDDRSAITVSGSLGLACTDAFGYVLRDLLARADAALYEAKRAGRDRVMTATPDAAVAFA